MKFTKMCNSKILPLLILLMSCKLCQTVGAQCVTGGVFSPILAGTDFTIVDGCLYILNDFTYPNCEVEHDFNVKASGSSDKLPDSDYSKFETNGKQYINFCNKYEAGNVNIEVELEVTFDDKVELKETREYQEQVIGTPWIGNGNCEVRSPL